MLQSKESEIGQFGNFFTWRPDTEYATSILWSTILRIDVMGKATVSARHLTSLRSRVDPGRIRTRNAPKLTWRM